MEENKKKKAVIKYQNYVYQFHYRGTVHVESL